MSVRVEDQSRDHVLSSRPASDVACGLSAEPVYPLAWKRGGGRTGAPGVVTPRRELRRRGAGEVDQTKVLSARLSLKLAGSGRTRRWCARPAGASDGGLDQHVQQPGAVQPEGLVGGWCLADVSPRDGVHHGHTGW